MSAQDSRQVLTLARGLGFRLLRQRAVLLLALCVVTGSAVTAALGFLAVSAQDALDRDVAQFLGAPMVVRSPRPLALDVDGLERHAQTAAFTVGATGPEHYHSIALKAVTAGYPVQGELVVDGAVAGPPTGAGAWLDRRAMVSLGASVGDEIQVGQARFEVSGELQFEPDRLTQLQHTLPRVIIRMEALPGIGLDLDSGRGEFRHLLAGTDAVLDRVEASAEAKGADVLKPRSGAHPLARMSERAGRFLGMVSVLVLLLCGGAAAVLGDFVVRRYAATAAVLRCVGVARWVVARALLLQLAVLALASGLIGSLVGWLVQPLLASVLEPHLILDDTSPDPGVLLLAVGFALLTLAAFFYPRLRALGEVPAGAALTGAVELRPRTTLSLLSAGGCAVLMLWLLSDNLQLTAILGGGVAGIVVAAWSLGWLIGNVAGQLHRITRGWLRVGLRATGRRALRHAVPMATIAVAVMAFLSTAMLRGAFLDTYHGQRVMHDGNYLFSRLAGNDVGRFEAHAAANGLDILGLYPTVRAHLAAINGVLIDDALTRESETREEARSPVRLSYAEALPANNELFAGAWPEPGSGTVSVEAEVMTDLGLALGDELTFRIGDERLTATVSSRRGFVGGGSSMMFWFMFSPDALAGYPQEYLGGFVLDGDARAPLAAISEAFPDVVVTDLEQHLGRVRSIMSAMTRTMNALMGLLLVAALMVVLATAVAATDDRRRIGAMLRAIGASRGQVRRMWLLEQATIGFAAALIGVVGAHVVAELIFRFQFAMPYTIDWLRYLAIPLAIGGAFALLEQVMSHAPLRRSPLRIMQEA
ncbi:MAG: FtsX-like permease family protein [Pseudomonadota bacterium]